MKEGAVIWRHLFRRAKDGFSEEELMVFISKLIEHNMHLAARLEHLDSLEKLAERTVIEADKLAAEMRGEVEESRNLAAYILAEAGERDTAATQALAEARATLQRADEEARRSLSEADEKARAVVREKASQAADQARAIVEEAEQKAAALMYDAEEKADALVAGAELEARSIVEEINLKARAAEQQTEQILVDADERAAAIEKAARDDHYRMIQQAHVKAQEILEEAVGKAQAEAAEISRESREELARSRKLSEQQIRQKMKGVYRSLLSELMGREIGDISLQDDTKAAPKAVGQSSPAKDSEDALYTGTVEILIPAPEGIESVLQLHRNLRQIPQVKVVGVESSDKSFTVRVLIESAIPLLKILRDFPRTEDATPARGSGSRILLSTRS